MNLFRCFYPFVNPRRHFLYILVTVLAVSILPFKLGPVFAQSGEVVLDLPINTQFISTTDLISQAESLVRRSINENFLQDPNLSSIQVMVMASRNGEVVPILTTTVSRSEWQQTPQVNAWTTYYGAAIALLRRRETTQVEIAVASSSGRSTAASSSERSATRPSIERSAVRNSSNIGSSGSQGSFSSQIERDFDEGRLGGVTIQQVLSDID
jgi:hypothetical protein